MSDLKCGTVCSTDMDTDKSGWKPLKCGYVVDKISNEEVLANVEEDKQIMKIIQQKQHHWIGHILKHESILLDIIEG